MGFDRPTGVKFYDLRLGLICDRCLKSKDNSRDIVMQSEALTTITARYSLREDRIVIDGVIHTGNELQLAFTQRLARAVVAELVRRVSTLSDNPLIHDFAQEEAISTKPQSEAVQVAGDRPAWLVTHAHFQELDTGVRVIFTEDEERAVHLDCVEAVLRNLIDIFHKSFAAAKWDTSAFPNWVVGQASVPSQSQVIN